jgi:hypothetical protein
LPKRKIRRLCAEQIRALPLTDDKEKARRQFNLALKRGADPQAIIAGIKSYARRCEGKDPRDVLPAWLWLKAERWKDEQH